MKASINSTRVGHILVAAVAATWMVVLPRMVPLRDSDRGGLVSVAERLLAGDTLYTSVYDNKEPIFYYFVALQLALGPWAELAAEALLIMIAAAAAYLMAAKVASKWTAIAVSCIAVPIILTGTFYVPGYTELPGIVLVLVAIAASAHKRPVLSGSCIGLLLFTKIIFVPIAVAGASCFMLPRRRVSEAGFLALGAFLSALVVVSFLLIRGEFFSFIETVKLNVAYSRGSLIAFKGGVFGPVEHFRRIGGWQLAAKLVPLLLAIVLVILARRTLPKSSAQLAVANACVWSFLCSVLVLSLTGLWLYHRQILYVPSIIALLSLGSLFDFGAVRDRGTTVVLIILSAYIMGNSPLPTTYIDSFLNFSTTYAELRDLSPEARRLLAIGNTGSYARFGWDDSGHARGLRHWKLACPRFQQYPHEPAVVQQGVLDCASTVQTLIISANFTKLNRRVEKDPWNEFVARVERLLAESYSCDANSGLRVCRRHHNSSQDIPGD